MDSSTRILIGVVAGVIVLVVLAIALPRLIDREEATYPPNTPEGTVQRYIRAVIDEDADTALALLAEENTTACMENELREQIGYSSLERYRVRLIEVEEIDAPETVVNTMIVTVGVTYVRDPELFELPSDTNTREHEFELRRSPDGFWLIAESEWPIALEYIRDDYCGEEPDPPTEAASS